MSNPKFREITVLIPVGEENRFYPLLDQEATKRGISVESLCCEEILKLATKLHHIARCRPRVRVDRSVGRPRTPAEEKRGVEAYEAIEEVFSKLLKIKGIEAFGRLHAYQRERVLTMQGEHDWQGLESFLAERGWEKQTNSGWVESNPQENS